eukprot:TRINITY_DN17695_c0_g1_i1.p1 TRINITY_DN17695_c0_g1~~TRINITY_DN17695_c0_g1_i1.p1  ORF type:complete len:875 (-),score=72.71 TRINITY_DN17695_c0_g1_i1:168-2792(-)
MHLHYVTSIVLPVAVLHGVFAANSDPRADVKAVVLSGRCSRFTILTSGLIRLERSCAGNGCINSQPRWDDRQTFAVVNRRLPVPHFTVHRNESHTVIETAVLRLSHAFANADCTPHGFDAGEVVVDLLHAPFTRWMSPSAPPPDTGKYKSSVARIWPDAGNLNGTMNFGPAFAGGLDCYSKPSECADAYGQIIGKGLLSRSGYVIVDDTNDTRMSVTNPGWIDPSSTRPANRVLSADWYFLACVSDVGLDYPVALLDWARVGGAPSLPPLPALGNWYSRYYSYSDTTYFADVIDQYERHQIPLSVGVLDLNWHTNDYNKSDLGPDKNGTLPADAGCEGWSGFTFNRTLFPDPKRFFDRAHDSGLKMTLSVHMQNGIDHCQDQYLDMAKAMGMSAADIAAKKTVPCATDDPRFVEAFWRVIAEAPPIAGTADYWWLDYPGRPTHLTDWDQQEPASLYWSNRMFADRARLKGKRPVILARYGGLGQHRDGLGFSGDSFQEFSTLQFEVEMTPISSNVLFGWWSHDIGGNHNGGTTGYDKHGHPAGPWPGDEDPKNHTGSEMLLRWIQFGAFSPILRTHCETTCDRYVWHYAHFKEMRAALRLRDALVPYIYSHGRQAFDTGVSLLRPMYYSWPNVDAAYEYRGQYMFGSSMLVAPVTSKADNATHTASKSVWLPADAEWLDFQTGAPATRSERWSLEQIPVFVVAGSVVPMRSTRSTYSAFAEPLILAVWPGHRAHSSGEFELFEDAGEGLEYTQGYDLSARTRITFASSQTSETLVVEPSKGHFEGQRESRTIVAQVRGAENKDVQKILVNGHAIPRARSSSATCVEPKWYYAAGNEGDEFVEPRGTLVVCIGKVSIRTKTVIELQLEAEASLFV